MLPLRTSAPADSLPLATYMIVMGCVMTWLQQVSLEEAAAAAFQYSWALEPRRVVAAVLSLDVASTALPSLVSYMFLHAGWEHIAFNLCMFFVFAKHLEHRMGHVVFLACYLFWGVVAAAAHVAYEPGNTSHLVGASGAVSGVMGAYMVFAPKSKVVTFIPVFFVAELPAWVFLLVWIGFQLLNTYAMVLGESTNIAYLAHVGGFGAGVLTALVVPKRDPDKARPRRRRRKKGPAWEP